MHGPADLIITNARAITMDAARPGAEAVALAGRQILYVGASDHALQLRGRATRLVDAGGATLTPGLTDSHYHLLLGSLKLDGIQLGAAAHCADLAAAVQAYAAAHPRDAWLAGYGLRYNLGPQGSALTRHDLDAIVPDRPLVLFAFDGHTAWANTAALERGGLIQGRECGPNSVVVMAEDGLAAGELREPGAFRPLQAHIPASDAARTRVLLRQGLAQAARLGITAIHNMDGDPGQLALYQALERAGELTLRIYVPYSVTPATEPGQLTAAAAMRDTCQGLLVRAGSVKLFMDGVVEGYTGLLLEPYAGRPDTTGDANYTAEHFNALAIAADRLGLQVIVHAIGDLAVRRTLDGFEAALRANGRRDARHRVEHIELIHADDLPRFAALGAIASMQPYHAPVPPDYGAAWLERVGRRRWRQSFAWRTLRDAGARMAFGSDWPVVSQDPLLGLSAAVNRAAWAPDLPAEALSLADALAAYTSGAAYAEHQEQRRGALRAGMLADLTLFDRDIARDPAALTQARVAMTVCDGRVVFEG